MEIQNTTYKDIFEYIECNSCMFNCKGDAIFLDSLSQDGYDGWKFLQTPDKIKKCKSSGLTSVYNTGFIYYDLYDCYYSINIVRKDFDTYSVVVKYCQTMYVENQSGKLIKHIVCY